MGMLLAASKEEESDSGSDNEELYIKLFPKIGRDFVHRDDLYKIIDAVLAIVDPAGLAPVDLLADIEARKRALEYKVAHEAGVDTTKLYKDLINMDD